MSHIAHMRNKFKSMNTFEQSYIDYKETIISFFVWSLNPYSPKKRLLKKGRDPSFEQIQSPSPKDVIFQVWLKLA